uniref:PIH1 N-terminal domain-containing protein n=1 Tax=Romanomermis culicivorax TaxID=13658 RepID=A0A915I3N5_ROMCU
MSKLEILTNEPSWNIAPKAAFCVKTSQIAADDRQLLNGAKDKVFINICLSEDLPAPEKLINEQELASILESNDPGSYRIPISLSDPHEETDRKGQPCTAYDVILNSLFYKKRVENSDLFQTFIVVVAMDAICDKYRCQLDRHNWVKLKNKKQMGEVLQQRVRKKAKPLIEEIGDFPSTSGDRNSTKNILGE